MNRLQIPPQSAALGDGQARALLNAPGTETEKGKRDRAILSVLLHHGLRREELCTLKVRDIHGKSGKVRYLSLHPGTAELVTVEVGWRLDRHLATAIELGELCSNDPVCAQHRPDQLHEGRPGRRVTGACSSRSRRASASRSPPPSVPITPYKAFRGKFPTPLHH